MDVTWVTDRIGVGGGIWNENNMRELARMGVTHDIDMQIEFNDTPLAEPHGIDVLWNPTDDDFQPKEPELFEKGVEFALSALEQPDTKLYIHCAAGVHRAPMMALAVLCASGWDLEEAVTVIQGRRPVVDFADVYVESVKRYLESRSQVTGVRPQEKD
jgi:protein-tyrosine phosphatase